MESSKQIDDKAAEWLVKRDAGSWTDGDQVALDRWLESSTANVVAYVRLEAAWQRMHRLKSLGAGIPAGVVPSPDEWQLSPFFDEHSVASVPAALPVSKPRRQVSSFKYGLAASLVLGAFLSIVAYVWLSNPPSYRTAIGGLASVPMTDGSKITLNTDSEIRVTINESERRVQLDHGEAFFEVAKDPSRPFVVSAGNKRVIAVGTAFSVRRDADGIRVVVTEGKVKIEQSSLPLGGEAKDGQREIFLAAGGVARTEHDHVVLQQKAVPEVEEALSWRSGYLIFREATLADAAAEFNRYNSRKIIVEDRAITAIRLSGKFQSTQYEAFIRLLEEAFTIRAQTTDNRVVLTAR